MDYFNHGSGLTNIEATQVITSYLITDDINSVSGTINYNYNNLSNVNTINGLSINDVNSKTIWSSNAANYGSNVARDTSNLLNSNFTFTSNNISTYKKLSCSNLDISHTLIRVNGSNFIDTDKKISYNTWIKDGPQYSNDNSLAVAGLVVGGIGVLSALGGQLLTQSGIGDKLKDNISDLLGDGAGASEDDMGDANDMYVHWNRITYPPFYTKRGKTEIAIQSNLYVSRRAGLYGINHDDMVAYDGGREKRIVVGAETKLVYDFSNDTLYCDSVEANYDILTREVMTSNLITSNITSCNILTSNLIVSSNITCSNINTSNCIVSSNLSALNIVASNIQSSNGLTTGNLTINSNGYFMNYAQPFDEFQVINRFGRYMGEIYLNQIVDIESLDLNKLKAGEVKFDNYSVNPLFEATINAFDTIFDF